MYVLYIYVPICMYVCAYSCMRMLEPNKLGFSVFEHSLGKAYELSMKERIHT